MNIEEVRKGNTMTTVNNLSIEQMREIVEGGDLVTLDGIPANQLIARARFLKPLDDKQKQDARELEAERHG